MQAKSGDWVQGPFWPKPVQIASVEPRNGYDIVTVYSHSQGVSHSCILTPADWQQVHRVRGADSSHVLFDGDPLRFRLGIEAHRLRLAHSIDPYAALNASRIDPLPHQFEAVYEHMLARPVVRTLLAHDAGAGKTIMAGMVIKELQRRQGARRVLIVAPAGLTIQWRRELLTKFGVDFAIVSRQYMQERSLDSLDVWRETDLAITSLDFAKQKRIRQALETVEWDLVVVDEAHKMAAYVRPNGSVEKTQAYELGETLSRHTTHLLLMTATPHKGDKENYRLLVSLLEPQWSDLAAYAEGANPMVLRRTKEEMRKPDGSDLYPERVVEPKYYAISHEEGDLLEQVWKYARKRYAQAKSVNQQGAMFALLTLSRRLASSPHALLESLNRMRDGVVARLEGHTGGTGALSGLVEGDWAEWEELSEQERWQREKEAEAEAAALIGRRQARAEIQQLDTLIEKAKALVQQGEQEKLTAVKEACGLWIGKRGEQLIVFTEFKDTLDYLVKWLHEWGYSTTQIHGAMTLKGRRQAERDFWDGKAQILVATEAAGEGINLQCCSVMINYDIPWNPCRLEQRMGRIHRYGQEAPKVYIFNLIARNTTEDEIKDVLLTKLDRMRKDLGDKVFDVVGEVLWSGNLRQALERIALGDTTGKEDARELIERAEETARKALDAESGVIATTDPLDIEGFRRTQATFAAHRLSPEEAEKFFRQAVPFVGGRLNEFAVQDKHGTSYPVFEVTPWPEVLSERQMRHGHRKEAHLRVSFWPAACSDDDTKEGAALFIAPGHWLFEALIDRVIDDCQPDLEQGSVYLDLQPDTESPYLVWFVSSRIHDGLGRPAGDMLTATQHRADREAVIPVPTEILNAFEQSGGEGIEVEVRQGNAMLEAQNEVVDWCVQERFLPDLSRRQTESRAAAARDQRFLRNGLDVLADHLTMKALDAYAEGDVEAGERWTEQSNTAQQRKRTLLDELERSGYLVLTVPEVLAVALVLPAPLEVAVEEEGGTEKVLMRRDDEVEQAAMQAVMDYEAHHGRLPRDVHVGNSWDIESYDAHGNLLRYIEVKGRGPEDANVVTLTEPEWEAARRLQDQHWLYIVGLGDGVLWMVQNPYAELQPKELKRWVVDVKDVAEQGEAASLA